MKQNEMRMITLENKNPTDTEKKMFSFGGLYLVESNEYILKYARINTNIEDFPTSININSYCIEWEHIITFHLFPETVTSSAKLDMYELSLITNRMRELGFTQIKSCH